MQDKHPICCPLSQKTLKSEAAPALTEPGWSQHRKMSHPGQEEGECPRSVMALNVLPMATGAYRESSLSFCRQLDLVLTSETRHSALEAAEALPCLPPCPCSPSPALCFCFSTHQLASPAQPALLFSGVKLSKVWLLHLSKAERSPRRPQV